jgi:L-methionine (R)-S-oxide reductase
MGEDLKIEGINKEELYQSIIPQIKALVTSEDNLYANLGNISAALKEAFDFFWIGFYLVNDSELILGPFQGRVACTRISKGKGVCGKAWELNETIVVADVDLFPGHIACSSLSKSEIVVPILKNKQVFGVLDVDSDVLNDFDEIDKKYLEELCLWLGTVI